MSYVNALVLSAQSFFLKASTRYTLCFYKFLLMIADQVTLGLPPSLEAFKHKTDHASLMEPPSSSLYMYNDLVIFSTSPGSLIGSISTPVLTYQFPDLIFPTFMILLIFSFSSICLVYLHPRSFPTFLITCLLVLLSY